MRDIKKARIGFIGLGSFISNYHLQNAFLSKLIKIEGLCDINPETVTRNEKIFKPAIATTDYKDLINSRNIDIIIIGTPQETHAGLVMECLKKDKWIYCEKPLCETGEEAREILSAEKKSRGKLAIGFNRRFAPPYVKAKQLLTSFKKPVFMTYRLASPGPVRYKQIYKNKPHIIYEGTHILDLMCWFNNDLPRTIYAAGDPLCNNLITLEFDNGNCASIACVKLGSPCLWKEYLEIFAENASITVSEFIDMRIRGIPGAYDTLYPLFRNNNTTDLKKHGFDFFEMTKNNYLGAWKNDGLSVETVKRHGQSAGLGRVKPNGLRNAYGEHAGFGPNKGWMESLEQFALAFINKQKPRHADGTDGAVSTLLGLEAIKSLKQKKTIRFKELFLNKFTGLISVEAKKRGCK